MRGIGASGRCVGSGRPGSSPVETEAAIRATLALAPSLLLPFPALLFYTDRYRKYSYRQSERRENGRG